MEDEERSGASHSASLARFAVESGDWVQLHPRLPQRNAEGHQNEDQDEHANRHGFQLAVPFLGLPGQVHVGQVHVAAVVRRRRVARGVRVLFSVMAHLDAFGFVCSCA